MTLIAAFWCADEQAVMCADSQETWGQYKTSLTKIEPQAIGKLYQLAYAGSGLGDLVDGLGDALEAGLERCRARNQRTLQADIQKMLVRFYNSPAVRAYPVDLNDPNAYVSGVICIRVVPVQKIFLFKFSKTIVLPVKDFVLRGIEEPIYHHIAKRLYQPTLQPLQARLLGLHLLTEAASTSNQIGPPMRFVFALTYGMFADELDPTLYVNIVTEVQRAMDELLLLCADTHALPDAEVRIRLNAFTRRISELRKEHLKQLEREFKKHGYLLFKPSVVRKPKP